MNGNAQHTPLQSVILHLFPGVIIGGSIILFSRPFFTKLLGVDDRLHPIVGYLFGLLLGLLLIQLTILLLASKKETEKYSIKGVIKYTEKSQGKEYVLFVPIFILYFIVLFVAIAPIIEPHIINTFFPWWPEQYNFQALLQNTAQLKEHQGIKILIFVYVLISGILGPFVEELYFRGYLLPRMENYAGKWAPLLNTILFSIYHFYAPWENLIRIVAGYPLIYLIWRKKDIRFGIFVHILINTIGGIGMLVILFS